MSRGPHGGLELKVELKDIFESKDPRDTDPWQPNRLRRVKVVAMAVQKGIKFVGIQNLTTGRKTWVKRADLLTSRRWEKIA